MGENLHKSRDQISGTAAELVQFPQNSLYHQSSSVLLPCPPHRISPFWEKEYQSRNELMSLLHQTSNTSQSSHRHYHKNVQEPTSWLKHSGNAPKMPHLNYRAMAAPLPRLHHLAKPASRHKHRTGAPVLPLPRTDIPGKKTPGALIPIDQCLIPPLSVKHQYDFPSDSDHRLENSSGSDHLPKIFPACDHLSIEDLSLLNPKDPTSTFSDYQTKVPLYKGHKSRDAMIPDTQIKASDSLARTPAQGTRVLPKPRRRIKATNALLGLFNLDPVLHPLAKSLPFTNWTKAPHCRTSSPNHQAQAQALKASHSDLQLREAMSFLQYLERHPRPLAVPSSHLNRKNRSTTVYKYNNRQLHPCSLAHVSVQTEQESWETKLLRKYLLDSRPCSPEEKPLTIPPEPSTLVKIDKEPLEAVFQGKAIQDIPPSSLDLKTNMTSEPTVHVSIQTEPDTWVTISQRIDLQEKLPSCPDLDIDMISEPIVHVSIQTELDTWETISPDTDFQETFSSSPDVETDITPEPTVHVSIQTELDTWETISPETDLQEILSSSPDLETDKTLEPPVHASMQTELDTWETVSPGTEAEETLPSSPDSETNKNLEPPVHASMQTELDTWETTSPEIDQEEIFVTGQDENIIPLDSSPQDITLSDSHQRTTPPSSPMPRAEHMPESNALVPLHLELERWKPPPQDHLAIFSSSLEMDIKNESGSTVKESVPIKEMYWEIILAMLLGLSNHQAITLIDEKHETASPLDLDAQERMFSSPDEAKTPLPSPNLQIEDISNPDAQATLKQKLEQWATLSEEANLCNTLTFTTESNFEKTPDLSDLDDHISDGIEKETIEIIDIMPLRIEDQEANQIVEDHWAITSLFPDNGDQENAVPAPDHQPTPILSLDQEQEAEDIAHDLAQDLIVQSDQKSGEITPLGTDLVATILTGQDNEATMPLVDLKPKEPTQFDLESQIIPPSSPDQQTEDISDLNSKVSLQPESDPCDTMSSGTELQNIILEDQDQRIIPPLNLDNEEITLLSSDQCTTHPHSPDRQSEDLNTQATSPRNIEYSAKVFEDQEYETPPPSPSPSITISSISENETESGSESTHVPNTTPENVDDEEKMSPSPDKTISSSSSSHQTEAPTGRDHQPETELSSDHQDEVEYGFPHQFHSVQKRQTKLRLNYIKPYTIEGGAVSDKTAHAIINSIPQERIKNDICKHIPLPLSLDEYNSCEYIVCLICASWIPDGCPHEGMKYPCEAQLLAIPIPIPMCEEEIDIKFVFKCPEATVSSLFSTSSTHSYLKKSSQSTESSISDTMQPVPSRPKWFHFILGKSLPQWKKDIPRSPEPLLDRILEEGSISKEGEKTKTHRTSFRSLLERFQWRQKETK
ncbi:uncharacterized protein LOC141561656 isoform X3 [Sminthopsis crassicaudata]|uniref:uncharacterized protein LOC141561656 isoform X3 n=1 Tax=Sminthopsis crassicaudata TaxID=9301 RepID=UPI003D68F8A4